MNVILRDTVCWPEHGRYLIPGYNDTWNHYQKANRGRNVSAEDWKAERAKLYTQFHAHIADGGEVLKLDAEQFIKRR